MNILNKFIMTKMLQINTRTQASACRVRINCGQGICKMALGLSAERENRMPLTFILSKFRQRRVWRSNNNIACSAPRPLKSNFTRWKTFRPYSMITLNIQRFHHFLWNLIHTRTRLPPLMPILILWIPGPTPRWFCSIRFQVMAPTSTLSTISITLRADKPLRKSVSHRTRVS